MPQGQGACLLRDHTNENLRLQENSQNLFWWTVWESFPQTTVGSSWWLLSRTTKQIQLQLSERDEKSLVSWLLPNDLKRPADTCKQVRSITTKLLYSNMKDQISNCTTTTLTSLNATTCESNMRNRTGPDSSLPFLFNSFSLLSSFHTICTNLMRELYMHWFLLRLIRHWYCHQSNSSVCNGKEGECGIHINESRATPPWYLLV